MRTGYYKYKKKGKHSEYIHCAKCHKPMSGIMEAKDRQICEPCGGNVTEYNRDNPHPESEKARNKEK